MISDNTLHKPVRFLIDSSLGVLHQVIMTLVPNREGTKNNNLSDFLFLLPSTWNSLSVSLLVHPKGTSNLSLTVAQLNVLPNLELLHWPYMIMTYAFLCPHRGNCVSSAAHLCLQWRLYFSFLCLLLLQNLIKISSAKGINPTGI